MNTARLAKNAVSRVFEITAIFVWRIALKVIEEQSWGNWLDLMQQLGIVPASG
jgi:hypothetical protein